MSFMNEKMDQRSNSLEGFLSRDVPKGAIGQEFLREEKDDDQALADRLVRARLEGGVESSTLAKELEAEIERLEDEMQSKKGTPEWDDIALIINDKDRQLQAIERVKAQMAQEAVAKEKVQRLAYEHGQSGETTFTSRSLQKSPVPTLARPMASVTKSVVAPSQVGLWSRFTSWFSGATPVQREAGKKIAEALTPDLKAQKAKEDGERQARAQEAARAYEERALAKSRATSVKPKAVEDIDESGQAAK